MEKNCKVGFVRRRFRYGNEIMDSCKMHFNLCAFCMIFSCSFRECFMVFEKCRELLGGKKCNRCRCWCYKFASIKCFFLVESLKLLRRYFFQIDYLRKKLFSTNIAWFSKHVLSHKNSHTIPLLPLASLEIREIPQRVNKRSIKFSCVRFAMKIPVVCSKMEMKIYFLFIALHFWPSCKYCCFCCATLGHK